ncbi:hypothetical protein BDV36DRAFT_263467 [Aspergillus pseudocaelatus]|uniref:Uncharacterized protein n=1 Tax=Aspergillus pseudocaelatus TaxID=1825620 RepID=A0ABQ6WDG9_9EURO|nr:hypothetical protein BDV36DRAFT_263467 [Aspergillus pseudocaelatus]
MTIPEQSRHYLEYFSIFRILVYVPGFCVYAFYSFFLYVCYQSFFCGNSGSLAVTIC